MTSRERVEAALSHRTPDRCPVDFWAVPELIERLSNHFSVSGEEDLLDVFQVDMQFIFPEYKNLPFQRESDGSWFDEMGVHRREVKNRFCTYEEYASSPLGYVEDIQDFENYNRWPDPNNFDWNGFAGKIAPAHQKRFTKLYSGGLFEYAWALRGYEQFLIDMIESPEIAHFIMEKLCRYWSAFVENALIAAGDLIDIVYVYDDIAAQNSLLLSPKLLEEFIYPYHRRVNAVAKRFDKRIMYHSCGSVASEIPNIMKLPVDILNPLQPKAAGMDFSRLKKLYGDSLCFHGGICIQETMPRGTPEEVQRAARNAIQNLGQNGGYVMAPAHYMQNDTPIENVIALYDPAIR
ncbi:MAG: uroporphyrinogen decarboxylase family protein [Christensenella sp.]